MLRLIPTLALLPLAFVLIAGPALPLMLRPDPFLWSVLFLALFTWNRQSCVPVLMLGLLRDAFSITPFGAHAILYVIVFRLIHQRRHGLYRESVPTQMMLALLAALSVQALMVAGLFVTGVRIPLLTAAGSIVAIAIATALAAPVALHIAIRHAWHVGTPTNHDGEYIL
ncbi:MAG: hypothetical protein AB7K09_21945 [Planctomycetota bacterium]